MKLPLLVALLAGSVSAVGLVAWPGRSAVITPPPGKYTGVLTVRRTLIQEGLETTFTVKVDASIAADGQVTILTATPESPGAAANIENSVVKAAPRPLLIFPVAQPVMVTNNHVVAATAPVGTVATLPINPGGTLSFSNYLVNGSIPASLTVAPRMVYLNYTLTKYLPVTLTVTPNPLVPINSGGFTLNGASSANSLSPVAPGAVAFPPTSALLPSATPVSTNIQTPASRVSYEFVLRLQCPAATPSTAVAPR